MFLAELGWAPCFGSVDVSYRCISVFIFVLFALAVVFISTVYCLVCIAPRDVSR